MIFSFSCCSKFWNSISYKVFYCVLDLWTHILPLYGSISKSQKLYIDPDPHPCFAITQVYYLYFTRQCNTVGCISRSVKTRLAK
jgi:hypothetical protein